MVEPVGAIWMLWLQGWQAAPEVARVARRSWERQNPGIEVRALDGNDWRQWVPTSDAERIDRAPLPVVLSDLLRLELLHRHGGVWADATTLCAAPLADWLPDRLAHGFVAFARPGPDRPLSNWFLAAPAGDPTVAELRARAIAHWRSRTELDDYFWFHRCFAELLEEDAPLAARWEAARHPSSAPAIHRFHFAPGDPRLAAPPRQEDLDALASGEHPPVFKLTHKDIDGCGPGSLLAVLLEFGRGTAPGRTRD
ncbi:MAG: hypothetical protein RLZZ272_1665 [Actinomycetota bacterium]